MRVSRILAGTVLIAALAFFLVEGGLFMRSGAILAHDLDSDRSTIAPELLRTLAGLETGLASIQAMELNTTRTEAELAGLLNAQRHSVADQRRVFDSAAATFDEATLTVRRINDTLIPRMVSVLDASDSAVGVFGDSAGRVGLDVNSLLAKIAPLLEAATSDLADPAIHNTLAQLQATAENVDATSSDIHQYVHRMTAPVRGTWAIIKELLGLTWMTRGAIGK